ncbi:MAG: hypothetical protein ACJAQ6_000778 [Arenicella sp.]|jgi:hypothetical protein
MLILLLLAFVFVLFRSLSGPSITSASTAAFDNVVIGQTALRRLGSERVWVTRLSQAHARQAKGLDALVVNSKLGCDPTQVLCVISAKSLRSGIDLVYVTEVPAQLPREVTWHGGFIDPTSGGVFDFLGRAYKDVRSSDDRDSLNLVINNNDR